ncbi:unnamed protein product, partial [Durusdinium trenchii]
GLILHDFMLLAILWEGKQHGDLQVVLGRTWLLWRLWLPAVHGRMVRGITRWRSCARCRGFHCGPMLGRKTPVQFHGETCGGWQTNAAIRRQHLSMKSAWMKKALKRQCMPGVQIFP